MARGRDNSCLQKMPKLLVIADDLTGANDAGAQFAKSGTSSFVTTNRQPNFAELYERFEVVVVDSESRHLPADEARSHIFSLVSRARRAGITYFYKKTDSTMRGNIGSELEALLHASGKSMLCFVPALPQHGRTTRNGIQFLGGKPLHESAFAHDPRNPIRESRVANILAQQSQMPTRLISLDHLGELHLSAQHNGFVVFDAEVEGDLRKVGEAIKRIGRLHVLAGTAGFVECLPDLIEFRKTERPDLSYRLPMLVVNGSLNEVSLQQLAHAERSGFPWQRIAPEILLASDGAESSLADTLVNVTGDILSQGNDVLLRSVRHRDELSSFAATPAASGLSHLEIHERVARNTGRLVRRLLARSRVELLLVFGGDTLVGIASELRWPGFLPHGELLPGITVSEVAGSNGLVVISKSGGFGAESVLTQIQEILKQRAKC